MSRTILSPETSKQTNKPLDPIRKYVVVDCGDYCCTAYQGADGKWRDLRERELRSAPRVIAYL